MNELIFDRINDYCNENYNWFDNTIECKNFEIYDDDFNIVAVSRF